MITAGLQQSPGHPLKTPYWYYIDQTGNIDSGQVQTALEWWLGKDVLLPIFYASTDDPLPGTCNTEPDPKGLVTNCPDANRRRQRVEPVVLPRDLR